MSAKEHRPKVALLWVCYSISHTRHWNLGTLKSPPASGTDQSSSTVPSAGVDNPRHRGRPGAITWAQGKNQKNQRKFLPTSSTRFVRSIPTILVSWHWQAYTYHSRSANLGTM